MRIRRGLQVVSRARRRRRAWPMDDGVALGLLVGGLVLAGVGPTGCRLSYRF